MIGPIAKEIRGDATTIFCQHAIMLQQVEPPIWSAVIGLRIPYGVSPVGLVFGPWICALWF